MQRHQIYHLRRRQWVWLALWYCGLGISPAAVGQTIVGIQPENRRVVLEEFGGIYCVYCPDGHYISNAVQQQNPGRALVLNHQVGSYAQPSGQDPDLRNNYSAAIKDQTGLTGYPAATVNRRAFPGLEQGGPGSTALGRSRWLEAATLALQQPSPVNVAAQATLNVATRELTVYLEYYYTANSATPTNRLNVAILQNNILGPQLGGGEGNYYLHQHVVRDFLTGQWGELITTPVAGHFGSRTFTVTLPETYRNVAVDPVHISLAVFIAEGQQEILNGCAVQPTLLATATHDARLLAIYHEPVLCDETIGPRLTIRNDGQAPLTSLAVSYGLVDTPSGDYLWTGYLPSFGVDTLELPPLPLPAGGEEALQVQLWSPNGYPDESPTNNLDTSYFRVAPGSEQMAWRLDIRTDAYGYEFYWEVLDEWGEVHASGGNQVVGQTNGGAHIASPGDPGAYANKVFLSRLLMLPAAGCYTLRVLDDFGDGLCCNYGAGFYRLRPEGEATVVWGGEFGPRQLHPFRVTGGVVNNHETLAPAELPRLWPNPARRGDELWLAWPTQAPTPGRWSLLNAAGQLLAQGDTPTGPAPLPIPSHSLPPGVYVLRWANGASASWVILPD